MKYRWNILPKPDQKVVNDLSQQINIDPKLATILVQRGIDNFDKAKYFFRPSLSDLHDPFLMKDMDKAMERIEMAVQGKEKILIYGDYDVDGTTAVALVYTFFRSCKNKEGESLESYIDFYIPDRYKEGYGISFAGIDYAKENNFTLIISLDCGIKSIDKIDYANKQGVDFIICDHHTVGDSIPDAVAVLDPKRKDCKYPYKELSGCGIGFKLIQAYAQINNIDFERLMPYLDLCVVSIAADIVPITGENRILAFYGLHRINVSPRIGFKSILDLAAVKKELTVSDLVFIIGPRINAAGRIESGRNAVELLVSDTVESASVRCQNIQKNNVERQGLDKDITQQALSIIQENEALARRKTTVLFHESWHKGVVGIVASRLTEKYYRPTIILTESNGLATGSARSVKDFDVYEAISACSDLLEQFGGHKYAAGLTMKRENLELFSERFEKIVSETIQDYMFTPEVEIDTEINFSDITPKFLRILKQFSPFGPGNMAPVFLTRGVNDVGWFRVLKDQHLKMELFQRDIAPTPIPAIGFNLADKMDIVASKLPFDICYSIEENEWNGNKTIQLNVKDIRRAGD